MKNNIKYIISALIIIASIVAYFIIKTCIPFDNEDLTLSYYNTLMVIKALLFGFAMLSIAIIFSWHFKN